MIDWEKLRIFDDWAETLDTLLDEANSALRNDDVIKQAEMQKLLRTFRKKSPNEYCRKLDEIAKQAILDIAAGSLQKGIRDIAERSSELDDYVKDILSASKSAGQIVSWLNLKNPREIVKSLTEVTLAFERVKTEAEKFMDDGVKAELAERVAEATKSVISLRETIEKIA